MNSSNTNEGGWKNSEIRTYVNNDVCNALPSDLQTVIKTVNKVSDIGNKDTTTLNITEDKLFLLSFEEVGFTTSNNPYFIAGQGTKYDCFTDDASRVKSYLSGGTARWWLRSTSNDSNFYYIHDNGKTYRRNAHLPCGIIFGFCI